MTEQELQELCRLWQKRLRLQDWDVTVKVARQRDMDTDSLAECGHQIRKRTAEITLLDPIDYPPGEPQPQDHEVDLVHELLHLHFAPFRAEDGSPEQIAQEQAIHAISKALVQLARKGADEHGEDAGRDNG